MPDDLILPSDVLYNYFIIYHNVIKMEMKCTVNLVHLNNPQIPPLSPPPPQSMEKLSSVNPVPAAKKFGDCCLRPTARLTNRMCHVSPNPLKEMFNIRLRFQLGLPGGSVVKSPAAMQETQVQSLGWDNLLEQEMATHSSILAWRIPWTVNLAGLSP